MRQPFGYYGGKVRMLPELLKLIPNHKQYCELFVGGGSLFWNKTPSDHEVINDFNGHVTNFYMQIKTNYEELNKMIQGTLHSEILYKEAQKIIFDEPEKHDDLKRAWAWWTSCNLSFSFIANGGFAFSNSNTNCKGTKNKRARFTEELAKRVERVEIFNRDVIEMIECKDGPDTFFYLDPPYVSSNQGHYAGYTEAHFTNLLNCLQNIKGKFLLSCYPEDILMKFREECSVEKLGEERGWRFRDVQKIVSVDGKREDTKYKIECLTYNYSPPSRQDSLFTAIDFIDQEEEQLEN